MINVIDGGTMFPRVPALATTAGASPFSYFAFNISGMMIRPIVAVAAELEPEASTNPAQEKVAATARPPYT